MYYKVKKDSETGRKFTEVLIRAKEADEAAKLFMEEIGAVEYLQDFNFFVSGGIEAVNTVSETKGWKISKSKYHKKYFVPDRKTKEGRVIEERIRNLPKVRRKELNECVGFSSIFANIGFIDSISTNFYFFSVPDSCFNDSWQPPFDAFEITYSEYKKGGEG